jgi:hypothetical protein
MRINIYDRPQDPGWYRVFLQFEQLEEYHKIARQIDAMRKNPALLGMGGKVAQWGAFGIETKTATGTKITPIDPNVSASEWPPDLTFYPGAALATIYTSQRGIPAADGIVIYVKTSQQAPPAPDGRAPALTVYDTDQKQVVTEQSTSGQVFNVPTAGGARPMMPAWPAGAAFAPVPAAGFLATWAGRLIVLALVAALIYYLTIKVKAVFFKYLGRYIKHLSPVLAAIGFLTVGAALLGGGKKKR